MTVEDNADDQFACPVNLGFEGPSDERCGFPGVGSTVRGHVSNVSTEYSRIVDRRIRQAKAACSYPIMGSEAYLDWRNAAGLNISPGDDPIDG